MRSLLAILIAAFLVGGFAGSAAAQSPTQDAYGGVLGEQVEDDDTTPPPSEPRPETEPGAGDEVAEPVSEPVVVSHAQTGSSLPFTGLDLAVVVLIGAGLLGLGFGLRWASRRTPA